MDEIDAGVVPGCAQQTPALDTTLDLGMVVRVHRGQLDGALPDDSSNTKRSAPLFMTS